MTGRRADRPERLNHAPLRLPRPRGGVPAALRWLAATALVGVAAVLLSGAGTPRPGESIAVLAAARDLAPGVPLAESDVQIVRLPRQVVPRGVLRPDATVNGRAPAGPVRRGEPLTDVRLMGPALVTKVAGHGAVAVPVRISDAGAVRLLHPGEHLDVIATPVQGQHAGRASVVATDVSVLAVPSPDSGALGEGALGEGALVVLATAPPVAKRLAESAVSARLSIAVRSR